MWSQFSIVIIRRPDSVVTVSPRPYSRVDVGEYKRQQANEGGELWNNHPIYIMLFQSQSSDQFISLYLQNL
jgi:hypothetical protein